MRLLSISLNFVCLLALGYAIGEHGMPSRSLADAALLLLFCSAFLVSIVHAYLARSESLLALYLQRLKLEQANKIAELRTNHK